MSGGRDRWHRVTELINDALDRSPDDRPSFLREACADGEMRHQVKEMLVAQERAGDFLAQPIFSLRGEGTKEMDADSRIGPYRLIRLLGKGGMGAVYLGERADGGFDQKVAIKLLKRGTDTEEILRRFEAERQILASLIHFNVARLLDGGTSDEGLPYFVMEYIEGTRIDAYCDTQRLSIRSRVELFRAVCDAVHAAHKNLVVHRDLKPANILVTPEGCPKLLDFGIAKLLSHDPRFLTSVAEHPTPMTPHYASPEQVRVGPITTATDVYALGVLLYELLTGQRPNPESLPLEQLREAICEQTPRKPSKAVCCDQATQTGNSSIGKQTAESVAGARRSDPGRIRRQLAGDLDNIVMKALQKEPERRFSSVDQFSEDLRRYLRGLPIHSRPDTLAYRTGKFLRRNAWSVTAATAAAVLVLGFAIAMAIQRARIAHQNEEIVRERDRSRAVTDYLVGFLKASDPRRAKGASLTVQEALDEAVAHLDTELWEEPEIRAEILDTTGRVYMNLALYQKAKPLLEAALALRAKTLAESHPQVAESLHNLANLELKLGDRDRAEGLMRQALAIQSRAFPEGHRDQAMGLKNLASVLLAKRDLVAAEVAAREALAMQLHLFGEDEDDVDVALTLNTLASVLKQKGESREAEELYRRSVRLHRALSGPVDPGLANALNNLALLLANRDELDAALGIHQEVSQIRNQIYTGDHPRLVTSLNSLALVHTLMGDHEKALALLEEGISMQMRLSGASGRSMAILKKNQAMALGECGRFVACIEAAEAALPVLMQSGTRDRIAEMQNIHGGCLAGLGRFVEAEPMLLSSYQALSKSPGEESRQARQARQRLVEAYESWGRIGDAAHYRSGGSSAHRQRRGAAGE